MKVTKLVSSDLLLLLTGFAEQGEVRGGDDDGHGGTNEDGR